MLLTRSPLSENPKILFTFDLHVLSTPPAFILSQDQTLHKEFDSVDFASPSICFQTDESSQSPIFSNRTFRSVRTSWLRIRLSYHSSVVNVLFAVSCRQLRFCRSWRLRTTNRFSHKQGFGWSASLPAFRRGKCVVYTTHSPLSNRSSLFCVILLSRSMRHIRIPLPGGFPSASHQDSFNIAYWQSAVDSTGIRSARRSLFRFSRKRYRRFVGDTVPQTACLPLISADLHPPGVAPQNGFEPVSFISASNVL